jgi:hypothetical protein
METKDKKTGPLDLKEKRDFPSRKSLRDMLQKGTGTSGAPRSGPVATSGPVVEISAEGKDKPMVRHLPEVEPKIPLLGDSRTHIPLQGASTSSTPTAGGQGHLVSQTGEFHLAKKALSGSVRRNLRKAKAWASEAGTGAIDQPRITSAPK